MKGVGALLFRATTLRPSSPLHHFYFYDIDRHLQFYNIALLQSSTMWVFTKRHVT